MTSDASTPLSTSPGLLTRAIHAGELADAHGSPHTPIYTTTTFRVTQPVTTAYHGLSAEDRQCRGIDDALLRLSVGLEDADDLIA